MQSAQCKNEKCRMKHETLPGLPVERDAAFHFALCICHYM
jgi:hypothetical protein